MATPDDYYTHVNNSNLPTLETWVNNNLQISDSESCTSNNSSDDNLLVEETQQLINSNYDELHTVSDNSSSDDE